MTSHSLLLVAAKWLVAGAALLALWPAAQLLKRRPRLLEWSLVLVGFLPFAGLQRLSLNLISYETYRGDARGLELTALDLLLWTLALALPRARAPMPYRKTLALYFALVLLSVTQAPVPIYSLFSVWKLLRMALVLRIVARACEQPEAAPLLLRGMGLGVLYEALLASWQHWGLHQYQASGNLDHPNSLTMCCNLVAPIALALLLAERRGRFAAAVVAGALVCAVFGLSRGSLASLALALVAVFAVSTLRRPTWRKFSLALQGGLLAMLVGVRVLPAVVERFLSAPKASAAARGQFEAAAQLMMSEHPLGVGINQFSYVLEHWGYADRVGPMSVLDRNGIVHNLYLLTGAELGRAGLAVFLLLLALPLWGALRGAWKGVDDVRGQVLLGAAVALSCTYGQSMLEWLWRQTSFSYLFFLLAGLVAALERQLQAEARARRAWTVISGEAAGEPAA